VDLLLTRGADGLAQNANGNTPLNWAIQNKHAHVVQMLMSRCPNIDVLAVNGFQKSIVFEAFGAAHDEILKLVLEHPSAKKLEQGTGSQNDDPAAAAAAANDDDADGDGDDDDDASAAEGPSTVRHATFTAGPPHSFVFGDPVGTVTAPTVTTNWTGAAFSLDDEAYVLRCVVLHLVSK
jgi:ankyrin repeat protein